MYKVRIDKFEGPFDLLVYLLENARMDIYDIKVAEITEQYIDYLKEMDDLNIEVDTEFIVLAAVLIRLKSHMLLPRMNEEGELEIIEDPRLELQGRLLEYMRTKKAAEFLQAAEEYNLAIHEKPAEDMSGYMENPDEILRASDEQLVNAFILFLTRKKKVEEVEKRYQRVRRRKESIEARIMDMTLVLGQKLRPGVSGVSFTELLPEEPDRYDITLSFMSLLSMIKNMEYDAEQKENFGEITIVRKDPEILAAQADAEAAGVIEYDDDEFDDEFEAIEGDARSIMDDWDIGTEENREDADVQ
ncbi:MAG: segregation/condensation protein A [Mogibacterium sp.]|nr:segregation/condensation protein A [Mogibacterium sp.]